MNIAVITSVKSPYRVHQLNEIGKDKEKKITVYFTHEKKDKTQNWEEIKEENFSEVYLNGRRIMKKYGYINTGLRNIVKNNEMIFIGGYEQPTYILVALLCKIYKKPYVIIYDGISCDRLKQKESGYKKLLKSLVIKNASYIWGNGEVSKRYFNQLFNYPKEKIYNQCLSVDGEKIKKIGEEKESVRKDIRNKLKIGNNEIVLHYSGRLVKIKNVELILKAMKKIGKDNITLLVTGGGEEEKNLRELAKKLNLKLIITGFIEKQEELFKYYYASDVFILPSIYEPWGLVVNEAMFAGLPILVSDICGCSLDLVIDNYNGYKFNPNSVDELSKKILKLIFTDDYKNMGEKSKILIDKWNFKNSAKTFDEIIKYERKIKASKI